MMNGNNYQNSYENKNISIEEAVKYQEIDGYAFIHKKEMVIFDTIEERNEYNSGIAKKRALQKLTPEERVALGFPVDI